MSCPRFPPTKINPPGNFSTKTDQFFPPLPILTNSYNFSASPSFCPIDSHQPIARHRTRHQTFLFRETQRTTLRISADFGRNQPPPPHTAHLRRRKIRNGLDDCIHKFDCVRTVRFLFQLALTDVSDQIPSSL
jgi:hypothetical protein